MADSALIRTARALDLIPYLVEHPGMSVPELADKFQTTTQEISETLNILFMCGLPGYTHLELIDLTTEDDIVSIIDPQNLNRARKLSQQEIVSLLLGLENLRTYSHVATKELMNSTHEKLAGLLGQLEVLNQVDVILPEPSAVMKDLEDAIAARNRVVIHYQAIGKDVKTSRSISPRRIYGASGLMYLEALNEDGFLRNFRIDRIVGLVRSPDEYLTEIVQQEVLDVEIEVLIPKSALNFLESIDGLVSSTVLHDDKWHAKLSVSHKTWILRALSAIPGEVQILSPRWMQDDFNDFAGTALQNYL